MIEASANPDTRRAMQAAREERAQAMKNAWQWLFSSSVSR
jgi:hypothetical protein